MNTIFRRALAPGWRLLFLPLLAWLSACAPGALIEKIADDDKEKIARVYIQRLADGDVFGLVAELDPALRKPNVQAEFTKMTTVLPKEAPTTTNLVGYHVQFFPNQIPQYNLTYQFGYGSKWVLTNVAWRELPDGTRRIVGMSAHPLTQSLQETHALSLKRAGPRHYVFLVGVIGVPVFILVTLVTCIRTKIARRKWLWIVFILLGFARFSLNWSTGQMEFTPLSGLLFGASAMARSIYSPWVLSFALPFGAALFWARRRHLMPPLDPERSISS
jgi:hypothetical protein